MSKSLKTLLHERRRLNSVASAMVRRITEAEDMLGRMRADLQRIHEDQAGIDAEMLRRLSKLIDAFDDDTDDETPPETPRAESTKVPEYNARSLAAQSASATAKLRAVQAKIESLKKAADDPIRESMRFRALPLAGQIMVAIGDAQTPLGTRQILTRLAELRVSVPGQNPVNNLSAHLSNHAGIARTPWGWVLRDKPFQIPEDGPDGRPRFGIVADDGELHHVERRGAVWTEVQQGGT